MRGALSRKQLKNAFRELQSRSASGILHVTDGDLEKRVYFKKGRIVAAESEDFLEQTPNDDGESAHQGAIVNSIFFLSDGQFRFEEKSDTEISGVETLDLSPDEVTRGVEPGEKTSPDEILEWPDDAPLGLHIPVGYAESTLSTPHNALLDVLRKHFHPGVTTAAVVEMSPLSQAETLEGLRALVASGIVEVRNGRTTKPPPFDAKPELSTGVPAFPSVSPTGRLGRFQVQRLLGRGSMGAVLLAQDPAIDRTVAIKLIQTAIHLPAEKQEKYRERFYREASAAGQLTHPNIVTVFDVGHADDDTPFIVMEYVDGRTLTEILDNDVLSFDQAFQIAFDLLEGLSFAHAQGIVHRDIKPGNIIVTSDFRGKIMDFGIAHVVGSELTTDDDVLGSPYYMAPEQLSKGTIDRRTDLFSFAVVLYRILTGELPFTGDSFAAIAQAILNEEPVPPDERNRGVNVSLRNVVLRCLEKNPEDRYDSAEEVAAALRSARKGPNETTEKMRPRGVSHRHAWVPSTFALALGALLVFGLWSLTIDPDPEPAGSEPSEVAPLATPPPGPAAISELSDDGGVTAESGEPTNTGSDVALIPPKPSSKSQPKPEPKPKPKPKPPVAAKPKSRAPTPRPVEPKPNTQPSVADLFYEARMALERGDLPESRARLEALLLKDPTFAAASEMLTEVTDRIWEEKLPLIFEARHNHRLGSCKGELSLTALGIRFTSKSHDWAWSHDEIRVLEHPNAKTLFVETFKKDILGLKNKRYKFKLKQELDEADWIRYERITR